MGDLSSGGKVDWAIPIPETDRKKTASKMVLIFFITLKLIREIMLSAAKVEQFVICKGFYMGKEKFIGHF